MKLKTIKELYDKVKSREIDEMELYITLDNDNTSFHLYKGEGEYIDIGIEESKTPESDIEILYKLLDIEILYKLLFPKAKVGWC